MIILVELGTYLIIGTLSRDGRHAFVFRDDYKPLVSLGLLFISEMLLSMGALMVRSRMQCCCFYGGLA
jgi:hypothetical protein